VAIHQQEQHEEEEDVRYIAGIDEAGRGPVLGSMVYGIAWCKKSFVPSLKTKGFADSKQLTPDKRRELMDFMEKVRGPNGVDYASDALSARDIGARMLDSTRSSLNEIAFESTCRIIEEMLQKLAKMGDDDVDVHAEKSKEGGSASEAMAMIDTVYVDTLGDPRRHKDRLSGKFPGLSFVVESKADVKYPVVSAASIVAKVERDEELESLASSVVGSGYPGDERTKSWLLSQVDPIFGFKTHLVRFSWQTSKTILEESKAVEVSWDCEDEDNDSGQQKLWSTYSSNKKSQQVGGKAKKKRSAGVESSGIGRHSFFRSRKLQKIDAF